VEYLCKKFHNARKKYASSKTPENKILLNTRAKEYRLVMNANYQKYTLFSGVFDDAYFFRAL
jgi:uncharacterized protein (DUF2235 family)